MDYYMDEDGIIRCAECGMRKHKADCDKVIAANFKRNMSYVRVRDGHTVIQPPRTTGRI